MATTHPKNGIAGLVSSLFGSHIQAPQTANDIERATEPFNYSEVVGNTVLLSGGTASVRSRTQIYQDYQAMMADPLVAGALRQHCTAALGGHETTGDLVFIEMKAAYKHDEKLAQLVKDLAAKLSPIFNRVAFSMAYNGAGFGDAYARVYGEKGKGVIDLLADEMVMPPLVQPYEKGNTTVAYTLGMGDKGRARLTAMQMARLKMPRMIYTPQPMAVEKSWRLAIEEDSLANMPLMPSLVGGSFLADAESHFSKYQLALAGLVGQRVMDSIDETIILADMSDMTKQSRSLFKAGLQEILKTSERIADYVIKTGKPLLKRIRHYLPYINSGKQSVQIQALNGAAGSGQGRAGTTQIDDVMFHAKLLCGALGIDISQLGFADIMSGGLGEGGFFRGSVQSAERSRCIRQALTDFFNQVIDIHLMLIYGRTFAPEDRPWQINFYGNISALETERTRTQTESANTGLLLSQAFTALRDSNMDEDTMAHFLERVMRMDSDDARMYASALVKAREASGEGE